MRTRATRRASPRWLLGAAALLVPGTGAPDEVHLTSGGVIHGVIVEQTPDVVVVEAGPGRVTLPMARVSRVVETESAVATFQERVARIAWDDVEGLARLARWAGDHDLATYADHTWRQVIRLDPNHPEANEALGRVYFDGAWMDRTDAYRAQGLVPFEGDWVTAAEHEAILRQRESEARAAADRREAELRVREAEARAREAEARAREAESYAGQAEGSVEGIPYWWVLAGGGGPWWPGGYVPGPPTTLPEERVVRPPRRPPYRTPPSRGSSIWAQPPPPSRPVTTPPGDPSRPRGGGRGGASGSSSIH